MEFASLQQLCLPILDRLARLPGPQQEALGVAFGCAAGKPREPFLVAVAALSLLSEAAEERPLLCAVDDAKWLDRASALALAFVARRLLAEAVAMVFVAREPIEALSGPPELVVSGVGHDDTRQSLAAAISGPLRAVYRQWVAHWRWATRGQHDTGKGRQYAGADDPFRPPSSQPQRAASPCRHS
jgi:hypothetical protein